MNKDFKIRLLLFIILFFIGFVCFIIGVFAKIQLQTWANSLLLSGLIIKSVSMICGIYFITKYKQSK